jgi:hypothetical protein
MKTQVDNQTHIHIFFISCSCLMIFMTMNVPSEGLIISLNFDVQVNNQIFIYSSFLDLV